MAAKSARDKIVDTALALAEQRSWEAVRLYEVADELDITLDDVRAHFREKEDIVDAWFDRADAAMVRDAAKPDFLALPPRERFHRAMMAWFSALAVHRRPTRQMITGKLEPGHIHYQISGLLRISRTVQWIREATRRDAKFPWRALEETALTGIYLMTFWRWMYDDSQNAARTGVFLDDLLARGEKIARAIPGCARFVSRPESIETPRPAPEARPG